MKPRWNFYRCRECHGFFVTVDVDAGTTPSTLTCKVRKGCRGTMHSAGYPDPLSQWPAVAPKEASAEWHKPTEKALKIMRRKYPALARYVEDGGLILRATRPETPEFPKRSEEERGGEVRERSGEGVGPP